MGGIERGLLGDWAGCSSSSSSSSAAAAVVAVVGGGSRRGRSVGWVCGLGRVWVACFRALCCFICMELLGSTANKRGSNEGQTCVHLPSFSKENAGRD